MSKSLRVTAVQFKAIKHDLGASRRALAGYAAQAAQCSDLVVLPEMCVSGYVFDTYDQAYAVSETHDGPTIQCLSGIAATTGAWIVAGFVERGPGGHLYNAAAVIDQLGRLRSVYRKSLLFDLDYRWATPGHHAYPIYQTPFGTMAVAICMDLNDVRFLRWLHQMRPRILAFPTNWIDQNIDILPYWCKAVQRSGCLLVAANTWGVEDAVAFRGHAAIMQGPALLGVAPHRGDHLLTVPLDSWYASPI